ncbi:MAG: hypothetical protein JWQ83_1495 [Lacunisphaera sp.]|nr:hypothetical protein [Lacunisphaera sp.]
MVSLLLSLSLFVFLALVGRMVLLTMPRLHRTVLGWLLAPAVGLSLMLTVVTYANQAGHPVKDFGRPLAVGVGLGALVCLAWRRDRLRCQGLPLFLGLLLAALFYAGWPALPNGLDWVSFANDDMANYSLGAGRFLNNGFYRMPTMAELGGNDYSQYYWFMHVGGLMRFGCEMLLAWVASATGLSPAAVFMPTIMALGLMQVSSAAALASLFSGRRKYALLVAGILALSPLYLLGIYYQLIAQVAGLGLLLAVGTLLFLPPPRRWLRGIGWWFVTGLCSATLCITYPEVSPFVGLAYLLHLFLLLLRRPQAARLRLAWGVLAAILCVLLLRENIFSYIIILFGQLDGATAHAAAAAYLFPYFLVPSGLANLFGWLPLEQTVREPYGSLLIVGGAGLLGWVLIRGLRLAAGRQAFGCLLAVMTLLGAMLFMGQSDFGLFKLAMFAQPALAGVLATLGLSRRAFVRVLLAGVLALQIPTAWHYARVSLGRAEGGFVELPGASEHSITALIAPGGAMTSDINHIVAAKFGALALRGSSIAFLSRDFFGPLEIFIDKTEPYRTLIARWHPQADVVLPAKRLFGRLRAQNWRTEKLFDTTFQSWRFPEQDAALAGARLQAPRALGIFNGLVPLPPASPRFFSFAPSPPPENWLVFVNSSRGEHYYLAEDRRHIGCYAPETDPYQRSGHFVAIGRFLLFRVENATAEIYLHVAASKSLLGPGRTAWQGKPAVFGQHEARLDFVGAGASSLFAGPLRPFRLGDADYVAVDLGEDGQQFPFVRHGLSSAYHSEVTLDPRYLVAFGRDISCISREKYDRMNRLRTLESFPADLLNNPGVEFSGWFEDGWISRQSYVVLAPSAPGDRLHLRGLVPGLASLRAGQQMSVRLNGRDVQTFDLKPGTFDLRLELPPDMPAAAVSRVELGFSRSANLPGTDARPVAAKIDFLGLVRE